MKVSGNTCTAGYVSGGDFINASGASYLDNDYYLQYSINSFSVFYPTSTNLAGTLSIPSTEIDTFGITIAPTVTDGIVNIKASSNLTNVNITIVDIIGRNIHQKTFNQLNQYNQTINLGNYKAGIYFMHISVDGFQAHIYQIKKILKISGSGGKEQLISYAIENDLLKFATIECT